MAVAESGGVPVSVGALKALAHRTRFRVLQALLERPKTVSELSRELEASKGTIHRHLETLEEAGFSRRREDDRQWVYHELTDRGRALAEADRPQVVIELAGTLVLGGLGLAVASARSRLAGRFQPEESTSGQQSPQAPGSGNGTGGNGTGGADPGVLADPQTWLAVGVVLVVVAAVAALAVAASVRPTGGGED